MCAHWSRAVNEIILLLPVLLHAEKAVLPNKTVMSTLDNLINRVVYKMFDCSAAEDINYIRSIVYRPCIVEDIVHKRKAIFVVSFSLSCISFADYIIKVCMHSVSIDGHVNSSLVRNYVLSSTLYTHSLYVFLFVFIVMSILQYGCLGCRGRSSCS